MDYSFKTNSVCTQQIDFQLNGDVISNIKFHGGCSGNLNAIAKLVDGMTVDQIEEKLSGNICGMKSTSCADQLAKAVREAYEESQSA